MSKLFCAIAALLAVAVAIADPPTPPEKPAPWKFVGSYQVGEGAGIDHVNVVIDTEMLTRSGDVFSDVIVCRDFTQDADGHWGPGLGYPVYKYKIDCKYRAFQEVWVQNERGHALSPAQRRDAPTLRARFGNNPQKQIDGKPSCIRARTSQIRLHVHRWWRILLFSVAEEPGMNYQAIQKVAVSVV